MVLFQINDILVPSTYWYANNKILMYFDLLNETCKSSFVCFIGQVEHEKEAKGLKIRI